MISIIIAKTDKIFVGIAQLDILMELNLLVVRSIPDGGSQLIFSKKIQIPRNISFYFLVSGEKYAHPCARPSARPPVTISDFGDFQNDGFPPLKRKNAKLTFLAKTNNTR